MRLWRRASAWLLTACMALTLAACQKPEAASMWLVKTRGRVEVSDEQGEDVELADRLGLFSGYRVGTRAESYGWIDLDEVKLTKLDQDSEVEVHKDGKKLELVVTEGSLFFDITEPLEEDEELTIRSANMVTSIRGTSGWVTVEDEDTMSVWILDGTVECSVRDDDGEALTSRSVTAWERAELDTGTQKIEKSVFYPEDVPDFVSDEVRDLPDIPEELTWTLEDGVLTVRGRAGLPDGREAPWGDRKDEVTSLIVKRGVSLLGDFAFSGYENLTTAVIEEGVTALGVEAFQNCYALESITLPESLTSIGQNAFYSCAALKTVEIPAGVTDLGYNAFAYCTGLTSATVLGPVASLHNTFANCSALTEVRLPQGLESMYGVFSGCESLRTLELPSTVRLLGGFNFTSSGLETLWLPASLEEFGGFEFQNCDDLTTVHFGGTEAQWEALNAGLEGVQVFFEGQ